MVVSRILCVICGSLVYWNTCVRQVVSEICWEGMSSMMNKEQERPQNEGGDNNIIDTSGGENTQRSVFVHPYRGVVYGECGQHRKAWISVDTLLPAWMAAGSGAKKAIARNKLWGTLLQLVETGENLKCHDAIDLGQYSSNSIVKQISEALQNSTGNRDADEECLLNAVETKGLHEGYLVSISLATRLLQKRLQASRSRYEETRCAVEGVLVGWLEQLQSGTSLKYDIMNGFASFTTHQRLRESVQKRGMTADWLHLPSPYPDGMTAICAWSFCMEEETLVHPCMIIGKVVEKQLAIQNSARSLSVATSFDEQSWQQMSANAVGRKTTPLADRLQMILDPTVPPKLKSTAKAHLTYCAVQSLQVCNARTGLVGLPCGISVDGLNAGKIPYSCVRYRSFVDIGHQITGEESASSKEGGKKAPLVVATLTVPPIRLDGVSSKFVYNEYRRMYQSRLSGDEIKPYTASLKEAKVFSVISKLLSQRELGKERLVIATTDMGSAQRKFWIWCMIGNSPHCPWRKVIFESDPPHKHASEALLLNTPLVSKLHRALKKLTGSKFSFSNVLSRVGSLRQEVLKTLQQADKSLPASLEWRKSKIIEEGRLTFGNDWTDMEVLRASISRVVSGVHHIHKRWCEQLYSSAWVVSRWEVLFAFCELMTTADRESSTNLSIPSKKVERLGHMRVETGGFGDGESVSKRLQILDTERDELESFSTDDSGSDGEKNSEDDWSRIDGDGDESVAEATSRGKGNGKKATQDRASNQPPPLGKAQYKYNVIAECTKYLRNAQCRLEMLALAHCGKPHLILHGLHIMECHKIYVGDHEEMTKSTVSTHFELYYPLASALTMKFGARLSNTPEVLLHMAKTNCGEQLSKEVGRMLLILLAAQTRANLERCVAVYRMMNYGKGLDFVSRTLESLNSDSKAAAENYEEAYGPDYRGSGMSDLHAIRSMMQLMDGGGLVEMLKKADMLNYEFSDGVILEEIQLRETMKKISSKADAGSRGCSVFTKALRGFHQCWAYRMFVQLAQKGLNSTPAGTDSQGNLNSTTANATSNLKYEAAETYCRQIRMVRPLSTRAIEHEGRLLTQSAGNNAGLTVGCPWRVISSQVPREVFPFLSLPSFVEKNRNDRHTGRPQSMYESFEDFVAPMKLTNPTLTQEAMQHRREVDGTMRAGQEAVNQLAKDVFEIQEGRPGEVDNAKWVRTKEEYSRMLDAGSGAELSDDFIRDYMKWGFDHLLWCEVALSEMYCWKHGESLLSDDDNSDSLDIGRLMAMVVKHIRGSRGLMMIQPKAESTESLVVSAHPNVNCVVLLQMDLVDSDSESNQAGNANQAKSKAAERPNLLSGASSSDMKNPDSDSGGDVGINGYYRFPYDPSAYCFPQINSTDPTKSKLRPHWLFPKSIREWDFNLRESAFRIRNGEILIHVADSSGALSCPLLFLLKLMGRNEVNVGFQTQMELLFALAEDVTLERMYDLLMEVPESSTNKKGSNLKTSKAGKGIDSDEKKLLGADVAKATGVANSSSTSKKVGDGPSNSKSKTAHPNSFQDIVAPSGVSGDGSADVKDNPIETVRLDQHAMARKELSMTDLKGVQSLTAVTIHRLLVMLYYMDHNSAIRFLVDACQTSFKGNTLLYFLELDSAREIIVKPVHERIWKRKRKGDDEANEAEAKRQKKEAKKAEHLAAQAASSQAFKAIIPPDVRQALGVPVEIKEHKPVMPGKYSRSVKIDVKASTASRATKIKNIESAWGKNADAAYRADLEEQRLNFHADIDLLARFKKEVDVRYRLTCAWCDDQTELAQYSKIWIQKGKGPRADLFLDLENITSRRIGPESHYLRNENSPNECFCGLWVDGKLMSGEKEWFNCACVHFLCFIADHDLQYDNPRRCACAYPKLATMKKAKTGWVARAPIKFKFS